MSGSGSNATYNQKDDVLNIAESARIVVTDGPYPTGSRRPTQSWSQNVFG